MRRFNESAYAADPVRLAPESEALVLDLLQHWLSEDGVGEPPPGIVELRNALIDTV